MTAAASGHRVLSIVIPAYNEERFIGTLLQQIQAVDLGPVGVGKEIIVIDDTRRWHMRVAAGFEGVTSAGSKELGKGPGGA